MDVRLFKFLVLFVGELVLFLIKLTFIRFLPTTNFFLISRMALVNLMVILPLLLIMPDDIWIWIVEDNYRTRKISLRSKAVKHLYLSTIYWFIIGLPFFVVTISYIIKQRDFGAPLSAWFGGAAALMGLYCAARNASNVRKFDTLFAVAWDRRSSFVEIFVGINVARRKRFFYPPFAVLLIFILHVAALAVFPIYRSVVNPPFVDREKFFVLGTTFNFFLTFSIWTTTMFLSFELLFLKSVERWSRVRKDRDRVKDSRNRENKEKEARDNDEE